MKTQEYFELYEKLGIEIKPLPTNYNPELYARELMCDFFPEQGVSYSASTNAKAKSKDELALK